MLVGFRNYGCVVFRAYGFEGPGAIARRIQVYLCSGTVGYSEGPCTYTYVSYTLIGPKVPISFEAKVYIYTIEHMDP